MGMDSACGWICAFCCYFFVPFVLQTVGFFTPMWGFNSTCDSIGFLYSCCGGRDQMSCANSNGVDELDVRALGLQATSFSVMVLTVFFCCCGACCQGDNENEGGICAALAGCCVMLFPVAGLFSVIGCIIVANNPSISGTGYSFYLCLVAGILILKLSVFMCIFACKDFKHNDDVIPSHSASRVYPSADTLRSVPNAVEPYGGGAAAPYEPGQQMEYELHHASGEQTVAVKDEETGQWFYFIRKFNFTRIVPSVNKT